MAGFPVSSAEYIRRHCEDAMTSEQWEHFTGPRSRASTPTAPCIGAEQISGKYDVCLANPSFGGFPLVAIDDYEERPAYQIVKGIYHTVVSRDILKRHRIKRQDLFDRVVKYAIIYLISVPSAQRRR